MQVDCGFLSFLFETLLSVFGIECGKDRDQKSKMAATLNPIGKSIKSLPTSLIETKLYKLTFIICGLKIKNDHRNRTRILRHDLMVKNVL
jgi:hypothetical protein